MLRKLVVGLYQANCYILGCNKTNEGLVIDPGDEIYRIVKPGGLVVAMVPDWESVYKTFYEDYTHRTPFTVKSLRDIFLIHGYDDVKVVKFRQLPFLWSLPWLNPFCSLVALIAPRSLRPYSKLIRFSQEIMLLSSAVKPNRVLRGRNE